MCNPNTRPKTTITSISAPDHNNNNNNNNNTNNIPSLQSPKTSHIYFDLLSIPTSTCLNHHHHHLLLHQSDSSKPDPEIQTHPKQLRPAASSPTDIIIDDAKSLFSLSFPIALTALILYSRSILSMILLGRLGDVELAAGSLAIAFANITGYSVLSGLALGMEPLCSQAFGARRPKLLSLTLQRSVVFLLVCSLPITFLWLNISRILVYLRQDPNIIHLAHTYLIFTLPDLLTNSFIHPIRIYLRAQGITHPLTFASLAGAVFHLPLCYLFVPYLRLGVAGVAAASAFSNFVVLLSLLLYLLSAGFIRSKPSRECLTGWKPLVQLAAPSCVSVCLEWWWYEIMIVLCGLLVDPKATVASMGVLIQTTSLIYVFPSSLGFAVSTRVGNELGANRPGKARISAAVSLFFAGIMGLSATVFASSMKGVWARMFTDDMEIIRLTSTALPILGLCELGNCPQTVGCGVVRGTARPSTAANVNLGAFYLVGMPVAIGLGFWMGVGFSGLWLGLLAAQICCAGLMLYVVGTTDWEYEALRAQLLTCTKGDNEVANTLFPRDGGEEEEPLISVTVIPSC